MRHLLYLIVLAASGSTAFAAPRGAAPPMPAFEEPHGADINEGKTPAQIFSTDCTACHKGPHGLARDRSARALTDFLRQHYTTGAPMAASLAAYLSSLPAAASTEPRGPRQPGAGRIPPAPEPQPAAPRRAARPEEDQDGGSPPRRPEERVTPPAAIMTPERTARPERPSPKPADTRQPAKQEASAPPKPQDVRKPPETDRSAAEASASEAPAERPKAAPAVQTLPEIPL